MKKPKRRKAREYVVEAGEPYVYAGGLNQFAIPRYYLHGLKGATNPEEGIVLREVLKRRKKK